MLHPWTYDIWLWNCLSALECVATEIKRYKSEIGIEIGICHIVYGKVSLLVALKAKVALAISKCLSI